MYARSFSQPLRYQFVEEKDADLIEQELAKDPITRQFDGDLRADGAVLAGHIRLDPQLSGIRSLHRLYLFPEENTAFYLILIDRPNQQLYHFPANVSFLMRTYLVDGSCVISNNGGGGYSRSLPEIPVIARVFPGMTDVTEMRERHRAVLQRLQSEGRVIAPLPTPLEIIQRSEEEHLRTGRVLAKRGYFTWGAAFRMAFRLVPPDKQEG